MRILPLQRRRGGGRGNGVRCLVLSGLLVVISGSLLGLYVLLPSPRSWYSLDESPSLLSLNGSAVASQPATPSTRLVSTTEGNSSAAEEVCLSLDCLRDIGRSLARAFRRRHSMASWCVLADRPDPYTAVGDSSSNNTTARAREGLLYVKVPKAASSTTAGVVLHVRNRTGCRTQHVHRMGYEYATRATDRSFLLGSIRNPTARALSAAFYFVVLPQLEAEGRRNATLAPMNLTTLVLEALRSRRGGMTKGKGGYQYNYLSVRPVPPRFASAPWEPLRIRHPQRLHEALRRDVLGSYDFLLIVERLEESMVALALLLGLPALDLVVLAAAAAKATGGGDDAESGGGGSEGGSGMNHSPYLLVRTGRYRGTCQWKRRPPRALAEPPLARYLASPEWVWINYADYILYYAADASLDRTIDETLGGRAAFERQLAAFRRLREHVLALCGDRILGTGCTPDGRPVQPVEDCYENDFGCGYKCVDEAIQTYNA